MKAVYQDFKEAENKRGAAIDIARRTAAGWKVLGQANKQFADGICADLRGAYSAKIYPPTPRDTFVAIKVNGKYPTVKNRVVLDQVEARLEKIWAASPLAKSTELKSKVRTEQGVIYRIPV